MAKVKGLDHGYLYTKDDEMRIFRSSYNTDGISLGSTAFLTINGRDIYVGAGSRNVQYDKSSSDMNMVTTITDLCMDGSKEFFLVCGLPIKQYTAQKDRFRKQILSYNDCKVVYQGNDVEFHINDVYVLPQGIGALLSMDTVDGDIILFDFGGMTIDIAYLEILNGNPILHKSDTWTNGIQKLYSGVINAVNEHYNQTLDISYAENIFVHGLTIHGEKKPTDFLLPVMKQFLEPIITEFKVNYPAVNAQIYLCGGSAKLFYELFKSYFPSAKLMPNCQFANAIGYARCGRQKFRNYIPQPVNTSCCYRR